MREQEFNSIDDIYSSDHHESLNSGFWSEKIFVATEDYEITGYVFMPKIGKKSRLLSDILNGTKRFVAIKDVKILSKRSPDRQTTTHSFIQLNLDSIVLIRPCKKDEE